MIRRFIEEDVQDDGVQDVQGDNATNKRGQPLAEPLANADARCGLGPRRGECLGERMPPAGILRKRIDPTGARVPPSRRLTLRSRFAQASDPAAAQRASLPRPAQ